MPAIARWLIGILAVLVVDAAMAQGKLPVTDQQTPEQAQSSQPTLEERIASTKKLLEEMRPHLAALPVDAVEPPHGVAKEGWEEYRRLLLELASIYQGHIVTLNKFRDIQQSRRELTEKVTAWTGLPSPPPHPVAFVNDLWGQVRAKDREIAAVQVEQGLAESLLAQARHDLKSAEQAQRKGVERLEAATGNEAKASARWLAGLNELRVRHHGARVARAETERELREEMLALRLGERELLLRQATAATRASPLTAADRDAQVAAIASRLKALNREIDDATRVELGAQEALRVARQRLVEGRERAHAAARSSADSSAAAGPLQKSFSGPTGRETKKITQPEDIGRLQREVEASQTESDAAVAALRSLRLLYQAVTMQQQMWVERYKVEQAVDPKIVGDTLAVLKQKLTLLAQGQRYLRSELELVRRKVDDARQKLDAWPPSAGDKALAERESKAYRRQEALLRRVLTEAEDTEALLHNWQETMLLRQQEVSLGERLQGIAAYAVDIASSLWDFELLTVEDKIIVEGREIVGKRSLTVGKLAQVLFILALGLWITVRLADRGRRLAMRRFTGRESVILLWYRLTGVAAVVGLLIFALVTVNIPLTVFAFLGGALAIAAGFGAQNILNNFISGLILLIERPIKLGDIVEVEGVRGRVTDIGSRCCHVHRFDGIDMLIPNSSFLERNVTNWTLADPRLRFSIVVNIAYGSPTRQVQELIMQAVKGQPEVIDDPAPMVLLEDFGDSGLVFRVNFWLDISILDDWQPVVSEVRFRIDELFRENGLVIALPQRDIHVDSSKPIRVEVVGPNAQQGSSRL